MGYAVKERLSNIELCRIVSIVLVMLVHTTFATCGWDTNALGIQTLAAFSIIGVNVFVLITGYFSATPKKSSLANLAFICLFWAIVKALCRYKCGEPVAFSHLFFITSSNWFIASYIGLLLFAPILNLFCNKVNERVLWGGVISLLFFEIWFDWLPPYPASRIGVKNGYSVLSFIILYLFARAVRLYGLPKWFKKWSFLIYIGCSLTIAVAAHVTRNNSLCFAYINPLVILSSLAFLICFEQLKIQSKWVNHLSKSTLAVLLGHTAIIFLYKKQFRYLYENFSGLEVVAYWALAIVIVFCVSIAIDQVRLLMYKPIENYMKKHIKQNVIFKITSD